MIVALLITAMGATHTMAQDKKAPHKDERVTFAVEIVCSNCVKNIKKQFAYEKECSKVTILSVADMFAEAIRRVCHDESISTLYAIK